MKQHKPLPQILELFREPVEKVHKLHSSKHIQLEDEHGEAVCDSDAELVCAKLGGIDISGDILVMEQALSLYRALTKSSESNVKQECSGDTERGVSDPQVVHHADEMLPHYTRKVFVRDLRYGQRSIKAEFWDGKQFHEFIGCLQSGRLNPLSDMNGTPFPLRVCRYKGHLRCLDNRRLYCLKEFQKQRPADDVAVLVRVVELSKFVETFISHMSDDIGDGRNIQVRKRHKVST
jgi:hypothetical protein